METLQIKICGVTTPEDAEACVALGATMLGLNFVPSSPRFLDATRARRIAEAVRGRVTIVGVVANLDEPAIVDLRRAIGLDRVQLHGAEPPALLRRLGPWAYKAIRVGSADDLAEAEGYEGLLLVDAKVNGQLGGTGKTVDPALVTRLSQARSVLLAGGLTPGNVAAAVQAVRPWGVDTASGVEREPGVKDLDAVAAFIQHARQAAGA